MDKYGPLYHRSSKLLPGSLSRLLVGVVVLIGFVELVLGTFTVVR